jgi:iron complex transport system substrate-binding protein
MRFAAALLAFFLAATVEAAPPARRVVSLAPSLTEMVYALGAGGAMVGDTRFCDYPPAAARLPKIGGMEDGSVDYEKVLGLRPDLVIAIDEGQETSIAALRRLGLRVEVIPSQTFDDVFTSAVRLGGLLGRQEAARELTAALRSRVERVRRTVAALPKERRPRVFYQVWDRPLMTASRATLIGRLIELAGGVNIFSDLSGRFVQISPEAVLQRNPQVILAPDHHVGQVDPKSLTRLPGFARLEAVKNGRVVVLSGDIVSRAGPRIADALELLAHAIHPELFPEVGH